MGGKSASLFFTSHIWISVAKKTNHSASIRSQANWNGLPRQILQAVFSCLPSLCHSNLVWLVLRFIFFSFWQQHLSGVARRTLRQGQAELHSKLADAVLQLLAGQDLDRGQHWSTGGWVPFCWWHKSSGDPKNRCKKNANSTDDDDDDDNNEMMMPIMTTAMMMKWWT